MQIDLNLVLHQIMTNGGLVLLTFLLSKIPYVGDFLKKVMDILMANPKH